MRPPLLALLLFISVLFIAVLGWWLGQPTPMPASAVVEAKKTAPLKSPHTSESLMNEMPQPEVTILAPTAPEITELSKLLAALKTATTKEECRKLAQAIVALGTEDAIEALWHAAIAQTNTDLRAGMLEGLDSVVSPQMITFTASVLKATTEPDILDAATQLATRGADMNTVGFLTDLYREQDSTPFQQRHISYAISEIRTEGAASALGALAQKLDQPLLAQAAARSLFNQGTPAALQQLTAAKTALSNSSAPEAAALLQAIVQMMKPPADTASPR